MECNPLEHFSHTVQNLAHVVLHKWFFSSKKIKNNIFSIYFTEMHFCSQSSRYAKQGLLKVLFSHVISLLNPRDLTYLCSNVLHSNEHKLLTIITSTCFSERSANLPTFIKTYIYIVRYFTSLCNKEKYTLIIQTEVKHRFLCTVLLQSVLYTCHKT